jgi:hypothetical protein
MFTLEPAFDRRFRVREQLRHVNLELRDRLRNELRSGSRVVSRQFDMGDWEPQIQIGKPSDRIYCWSIGNGPGD